MGIFKQVEATLSPRAQALHDMIVDIADEDVNAYVNDALAPHETTYLCVGVRGPFATCHKWPKRMSLYVSYDGDGGMRVSHKYPTSRTIVKGEPLLGVDDLRKRVDDCRTKLAARVKRDMGAATTRKRQDAEVTRTLKAMAKQHGWRYVLTNKATGMHIAVQLDRRHEFQLNIPRKTSRTVLAKLPAMVKLAATMFANGARALVKQSDRHDKQWRGRKVA